MSDPGTQNLSSSSFNTSNSKTTNNSSSTSPLSLSKKQQEMSLKSTDAENTDTPHDIENTSDISETKNANEPPTHDQQLQVATNNNSPSYPLRTHSSSIDLYQLGNYSFGVKDPQYEKDKSVAERMARMKEKYEKEGMKRTVEAVLLVHLHNHPHVLLLQIGNNVKGFFKLPGGRCRPSESEVDCMKRKLTKRLSPKGFIMNWEIGDCLATWWRPSFDTYLYPYVPAHIAKPKECKKLFVVPLPEKCLFSIPKNFHFLAVPLFELYDNSKRYGPIISSIPQVLSRYHFNYMN